MEKLNHDELLYKIDLYYHNNLDPNEAKSFEYEISNNSELKLLVKERFLELSLMDEVIANDIRNQFDAYKPKSLIKNKKVMLLALLGMIILGFVYYFIVRPSSQINEQLKAIPTDKEINIPAPEKVDSLSTPTDTKVKEIKPRPIAKAEDKSSHLNSDIAYHSVQVNNWVDANYDAPLISNLRGKDVEDSIVSLIQSNWTAKNYNEVCRITEKISNSNSSYVYYQWIAANAYYLAKNYDKAINKFQEVVKLKHLPISENAEWYIVLASIKARKSPYIISNLLNAIVKKENHLFHEESLDLQELLQGIE